MTSSVSVLIPARGDSPYISETLQSIELNSLLPREVIIIDDGLTEVALSNIKVFHERLPVKITKSEGNGLVDALNTGLRVASEEFICRIDSDDLMLPERIKTQLHSLNLNNQLVAVGSQCVYINEDATELSISNYPVGNPNDNPEFQRKCLIAHPSTMYYLDSALSIGGYRSLFSWNGTDIAEDFDFWLRLSGIGQILITDQVLTKYRQHNKQISSISMYGQILGTPYISAINKSGQKTEPIKIIFANNQSQMSQHYFRVIRNNLGLRAFIASKLTLIGVRHLKWFGRGLLRRILLRILNLLDR